MAQEGERYEEDGVHDEFERVEVAYYPIFDRGGGHDEMGLRWKGRAGAGEGDMC